ncbi:MAG: hypothetical protein PUD35_00070 [Bacteroidales bacterium]|nr:hypothetical protein [Bacteroidales bacterium]
MKTYKKMITAALGAIAMLPLPAQAQLKVGGYGEVALTRNFYSDNVYRYSDPKKYAHHRIQHQTAAREHCRAIGIDHRHHGHRTARCHH